MLDNIILLLLKDGWDKGVIRICDLFIEGICVDVVIKCWVYEGEDIFLYLVWEDEIRCCFEKFEIFFVDGGELFIVLIEGWLIIIVLYWDFFGMELFFLLRKI